MSATDDARESLARAAEAYFAAKTQAERVVAHEELRLAHERERDARAHDEDALAKYVRLTITTGDREAQTHIDNDLFLKSFQTLRRGPRFDVKIGTKARMVFPAELVAPWVWDLFSLLPLDEQLQHRADVNTFLERHEHGVPRGRRPTSDEETESYG